MFGSHKNTSYSTNHQECYNRVCIHTVIAKHLYKCSQDFMSYPVVLISKCPNPVEYLSGNTGYVHFLFCGCHQGLDARAKGKKAMISSNGLCDMHFLTALINLTWQRALIAGSVVELHFPTSRLRKSCLSANVSQMKS